MVYYRGIGLVFVIRGYSFQNIVRKCELVSLTITYSFDIEKVEKVVGFYNRGSKANWKAKAQYEDCGPEEDAWIPWKDKRKIQRVHTYLRVHRKANLIPERYL
jgi:hypothetical protein